MKKRIFALLMAGVVLAAVTACGGDEELREKRYADEKEEEEEKPEKKNKKEERKEEPEEPVDPEDPEEPVVVVEPVEEPAKPEYDGIEGVTSDLYGNTVDLQDIFTSHEYTMVNMWATWCGPCVGEIPELAVLAPEFEARGCAVVGLLSDGDDPDAVIDAKAILSDAGADYLNLCITPELYEVFYSENIPATFFVDSTGHIVGEPIIGADPEGYKTTVNNLLP